MSYPEAIGVVRRWSFIRGSFVGAAVVSGGFSLLVIVGAVLGRNPEPPDEAVPVPPVRAEAAIGIAPVNQLTTAPAPIPAKLSPWVYVAKITTDPQTGAIAPSTAKQLVDLSRFSSIEVPLGASGAIRFQESGFTVLETPRNPLLEAYIRSYFSPVDLSTVAASSAPAK